MRNHVLFTSLAVVLLLAACQTQAPVPTTLPNTAPPAEATPTLPPTSLPAAPAIAPAYVTAFCTMIGKDPVTRVALNTPVVITWGWEAQTLTQIDDFVQNNVTAIRLDGKTLNGTLNTAVTKNAKSGQPEVAWFAEVGVLDAGTHVITYDVKWLKMIDDGTGTYGPGSKNETLHDECRIVVE